MWQRQYIRPVFVKTLADLMVVEYSFEAKAEGSEDVADEIFVIDVAPSRQDANGRKDPERRLPSNCAVNAC